MAKIIDITEKLNFDESPKLLIKGREYSVNDNADAMLRVMGLFDDEESSAAEKARKAYEIIFSETDREELQKSLNLKSLMIVIDEAMKLIQGDEDESAGE